MDIVTAALSDKGGREFNQDSCEVYVRNGNACIAVCDGLGSYHGSEHAARLVSKSITQSFSTDAETRRFTKDSVKQYFRVAQDSLLGMQIHDVKLARCCTTAAVFMLYGSRGYVAHLGDSRVYLIRNGKVAYQSLDHSMAQQAALRGEIAQSEIRTHHEQNVLTRALGAKKRFVPSVKCFSKMERGDRIVLCTDGVWVYVTEDELVKIVTNNSPEGAKEKIGRLVRNRGDRRQDNFTIAIIALEDKED